MAKSDRLIQLMQTLRRYRSPVQAEKLAETLQVSQRTIYRDIETLRRAGALIDGEAGVGYTLQEDPALPPMGFSPDEIEAIFLGLNEVNIIGDHVLQSAAKSALDKIRAVLPRSRRMQIEHVIAHAYGSRDRPPISVDLSLVRQATRDERVLEIEYINARDQITSRRIWPLSLIFFDHSLVLLSWCELRNDFRNFRADRLLSVEMSDKSFRPRRVRLLNAYIDSIRKTGRDDFLRF